VTRPLRTRTRRLLDTDLGLDAVLNILGRIEHGVFS
jgi:uncharacterized protein (DUF2384 family)